MKHRAVLLVLFLLPVAGSARSQIEVQRGSAGGWLISNHDEEAPASAPAPRARRGVPAHLQARIDYFARSHDLDPKLVAALIEVESAFNERALSHKGAMGLMQLMPETASELGVDDPFDVDSNLAGGTRYLRDLLDRFGGDVTLALAGYNAGPRAVEQHQGVPPYDETRSYVRRIYDRLGRSVDLERRRGRPVTITRGEGGVILLTTGQIGK